MAKRVEAQSRSPAGSRPLASPRVTFTERPKPKTPASSTKELKCDKCDGPHATEDCPFFKGDRDDHPDARNRAPHEGLGSDGGRAVLRQARVVRASPATARASSTAWRTGCGTRASRTTTTGGCARRSWTGSRGMKI